MIIEQMYEMEEEDHITFLEDGERVDCCTVDETATDSFIWGLFAEFGHAKTAKTTFEREHYFGVC